MLDNITPDQNTKPAVLEVKRSLSFYFTPEQVEELKTIVELNNIPDAKSLFAFLLSKLNTYTPDQVNEIERLKNELYKSNVELDKIENQEEKHLQEISKLKESINTKDNEIKKLNELALIYNTISNRLDKANEWLNNNYSRIKSFCSYIPKNF
jgi:predicted  nucleic acid-binding Zn-ribbon protein